MLSGGYNYSWWVLNQVIHHLGVLSWYFILVPLPGFQVREWRRGCGRRGHEPQGEHKTFFLIFGHLDISGHNQSGTTTLPFHKMVCWNIPNVNHNHILQVKQIEDEDCPLALNLGPRYTCGVWLRKAGVMRWIWSWDGASWSIRDGYTCLEAESQSPRSSLCRDILKPSLVDFGTPWWDIDRTQGPDPGQLVHQAVVRSASTGDPIPKMTRHLVYHVGHRPSESQLDMIKMEESGDHWFWVTFFRIHYRFVGTSREYFSYLAFLR